MQTNVGQGKLKTPARPDKEMDKFQSLGPVSRTELCETLVFSVDQEGALLCWSVCGSHGCAGGA